MENGVNIHKARNLHFLRMAIRSVCGQATAGAVAGTDIFPAFRIICGLQGRARPLMRRFSRATGWLGTRCFCCAWLYATGLTILLTGAGRPLRTGFRQNRECGERGRGQQGEEHGVAFTVQMKKQNLSNKVNTKINPGGLILFA
jgi:hypothetical protein